MEILLREDVRSQESDLKVFKQLTSSSKEGTMNKVNFKKSSQRRVHSTPNDICGQIGKLKPLCLKGTLQLRDYLDFSQNNQKIKQVKKPTILPH